MLTFDQALEWANRIYLANRREFEQPPKVKSEAIIPEWKERQNRRTSFFDHLHAERQWNQRHK